MTRPCKFCGKPVPKKPKTRKYCSQACYTDDRNAQRARNCPQCGNEFPAKSVKGERSRFCSRECAGLSGRSRVVITCRRCGKKKERVRSQAKTSKFCSNRCAGLARRGKPRGHILHNEREGARLRTPYWKKQASRARKRDGYKCQDCGKQFEKGDGSLNVHHIIPWRLGGSDNLKNLLSLCRKCHVKADAAIRAEERRKWPPGVPRPKNVRHKPLPNHCSRGHEFTPENAAMDGNARRCRICQRAAARSRYAREMADPIKSEANRKRWKDRQSKHKERIRAYSKAYGRKKTEAKQAKRAAEPRPTTCKNGLHPLTPENAMPHNAGGARCRPCYQASQAAARARVNADPVLVQKRRAYHLEWTRQNKLKNKSAQASLF